MLRHSFAAPVPEAETATRYIQILPGHDLSKTTELYTQVSKVALDKIQDPLNLFGFLSELQEKPNKKCEKKYPLKTVSAVSFKADLATYDIFEIYAIAYIRVLAVIFI